jgi:hypothetical protein
MGFRDRDLHKSRAGGANGCLCHGTKGGNLHLCMWSLATKRMCWANKAFTEWRPRGEGHDDKGQRSSSGPMAGEGQGSTGSATGEASEGTEATSTLGPIVYLRIVK